MDLCVLYSFVEFDPRKSINIQLAQMFTTVTLTMVGNRLQGTLMK